MIVCREIKPLDQNPPCAMALGVFDGVHLGHRAVIAATTGIENMRSVAFTFERHPKELLCGERRKMICTFSQRLELFEKMGVDIVIAPDFSTMNTISYGDFFALLLKNYCLKSLSFGHNFHFGKNREGDSAALIRLCEAFGVASFCQPDIKIDGASVSSTAIKECLYTGQIETANAMLGREYYLEGVVNHGKQLGGKLGFATINQDIDPIIIPLKYGVYASSCVIDGVKYKSVTNYGNRPTVSESAAAETHVLDFEGNLYEKNIRVSLKRYLRPQIRFATIEQLQAQIALDVAEASKC